MRLARLLTCALLILLCASAHAATVQDVRIWAENGKTRVVLDLSAPAAHSIFTLRGPDRLVVDRNQSPFRVAAHQDSSLNASKLKTT